MRVFVFLLAVLLVAVQVIQANYADDDDIIYNPSDYNDDDDDYDLGYGETAPSRRSLQDTREGVRVKPSHYIAEDLATQGAQATTPAPAENAAAPGAVPSNVTASRERAGGRRLKHCGNCVFVAISVLTFLHNSTKAVILVYNSSDGSTDTGVQVSATLAIGIDIVILLFFFRGKDIKVD
ncbi:hypothetical protein Q1695_016269 [Nippostrongylus brasiliensis]|nr:hypothetical protein Q1695_016269 [Nippostrongylus brasiliensis]